MFRRLLMLSLLVAVVFLPAGSGAVAGNAAPAAARQAPMQYSDGSVLPVVPQAVMPGAAVGQPVMPQSTQGYVLGIGDRIKLTVYGEEDLSGEYEIGSTGFIALPLIGDTRAAGTMVADFERAVRAKLSEGYLHDPKVSAQVINYRPFFILGEVSKPGSYPYVNGMTVLNAVALAGGYTYRGDRSGVTLLRATDPEKKEVRVNEDAVVMPGDIIRIPERFF